MMDNNQIKDKIQSIKGLIVKIGFQINRKIKFEEVHNHEKDDCILRAGL